MTESPRRQVRRDDDRSRYELLEDGSVIGYADFRDGEDAVVLPHTVIERSRRGNGLGAELVRGALDDLRSRGHRWCRRAGTSPSSSTTTRTTRTCVPTLGLPGDVLRRAAGRPRGRDDVVVLGLGPIR